MKHFKTPARASRSDTHRFFRRGRGLESRCAGCGLYFMQHDDGRCPGDEEPDTSDIAEVGAEWFDKAKLVEPEK